MDCWNFIRHPFNYVFTQCDYTETCTGFEPVASAHCTHARSSLGLGNSDSLEKVELESVDQGEDQTDYTDTNHHKQLTDGQIRFIAIDESTSNGETRY